MNKRLKISLLLACILICLYTFLNYIEYINIYNESSNVINNYSNMDLVLGGQTCGIKLLATGVLVVGLERDDIDIKLGDVILKVNNSNVKTNKELINIINSSGSNIVKLEINRENNIITKEIKPLFNEITGEYKLGLWVKDSSAGVGTITFYDRKNSKFAALGHGVTETSENYILPITTGGITKTDIYSVVRGMPRLPGELKGTITNDILGTIIKNTDKGIYGDIHNIDFIKDKESISVISKSEIKEGKAYIYCTLDGDKVDKYEIKIEKVLIKSEGNRNMIIKVTDEKLLNLTGGIIQGMSGSPIVQDGKLIGAVTHVFLNDPTKGYGVFIENMLKDLSSINV